MRFVAVLILLSWPIIAQITGRVTITGRVVVNPAWGNVQLSGDGTYLTRAGVPWFMNGDTAWSLIVQPTLAEAQTYIDDRATKGYNTLLVNLIDTTFSDIDGGGDRDDNAAGARPFTVAGDFSTPNATYWSHVDSVLQYAASKGIVILAAPMYIGFNCDGTEGWCPELQAASNAQVTSYGEFLGNRYKGYTNIIWVIGGDDNPTLYTGVEAKLNLLADGIRNTDPNHIMTGHCRSESTCQEQMSNPSWLAINGVYTYDATTSTKTKTAYELASAKPAYWQEGNYENSPAGSPVSDQTLRAEAWQSVLWGARIGHLFGNCPVWSFSGGTRYTVYCASADYTTELNTNATNHLSYVGKLMNTRRHWLMRPDHTNVVMTAGYQSGVNLATTSRATDASSVIAYIPTQRAVTIDMTKIGGSTARAWWFNPRAGTATLINTYATTGTQNFTPSDTNDWVLVIDNDSLGLGTPGG